MSKYGYISLDMLYEYAMNTVDKTVSPNEFMRMSRANVIPIEWIRNEIASSIAVVRDGDYDYNYASCILQLLERWEKENGRSK